MTFIPEMLILLQIVFMPIDTTKISPKRKAIADTLILRHINQDAFQLGERLDYNVKFGAIPAGYARLSIPQVDTINNRSCYHIISKMWTNSFFSNFFRVDDLVESYVDVHGIFPWRFHKRIREGKYKTNRSAVFDHVQGLAYERNEIINIPPFSQDVLSVFYYLRTLDLKVGHSIAIDSYADKKYYPLLVRVIKKEKIQVPAGRFNCFLIIPAMRSGSIFEQKGEMWIWLSADKRRLPVLIKSKINVVGSLSMELTDIINTAD